MAALSKLLIYEMPSRSLNLNLSDQQSLQTVTISLIIGHISPEAGPQSGQERKGNVTLTEQQGKQCPSTSSTEAGRDKVRDSRGCCCDYGSPPDPGQIWSPIRDQSRPLFSRLSLSFSCKGRSNVNHLISLLLELTECC